MSGYLLDTNVVSMFSPSKSRTSSRFIEWLERADTEGRIHLSVVTIHEIEKGISKLEAKGATAKAATVRDWLSGLVATFADKILDLDIQAASVSGRLESRALSGGHDPGMADALIAGIAQAHGLTVVTCNTKHFLPFGISVLSPDDAMADPA